MAEAGLPLSIHVSLSQTMPSAHRSPAARLRAVLRCAEPDRAAHLRRRVRSLPDLRLVVAEADCGWVPYFKEQVDNNYRRLVATSSFTIADPPSTYVERNVAFTFITDPFGVRNRHEIGVENMLWSSDYPHISADWPNSWRSIQATFSGVPSDERAQILAGNAARLYGFSR